MAFNAYLPPRKTTLLNVSSLMNGFINLNANLNAAGAVMINIIQKIMYACKFVYRNIMYVCMYVCMCLYKIYPFQTNAIILTVYNIRPV